LHEWRGAEVQARLRRIAVLEFIASPDDVIAITLSGKITGDELNAVMDRVDAIMKAHEKIHVFAETRGIDGLQLEALPRYISRAFPLFGQLRRFGRVGVVADQTWMRVLTRLESAMLPFVSYRVFQPDERDEALAWVRGTAA
jgi:hypothetical protein